MNTNTTPVVFNPATFTVREEALAVFSQIDPRGETGRFVKDFGSSWKKIPGRPNHRFIGNAEKQVYATLWMGDDYTPPSFAIYSGVTIDVFKEAFLKDMAAEYRHDVIFLENGVMYAGGAVMKEMTVIELWK